MISFPGINWIIEISWNGNFHYFALTINRSSWYEPKTSGTYYSLSLSHFIIDEFSSKMMAQTRCKEDHFSEVFLLQERQGVTSHFLNVIWNLETILNMFRLSTDAFENMSTKVANIKNYGLGNGLHLDLQHANIISPWFTDSIVSQNSLASRFRKPQISEKLCVSIMLHTTLAVITISCVRNRDSSIDRKNKNITLNSEKSFRENLIRHSLLVRDYLERQRVSREGWLSRVRRCLLLSWCSFLWRIHRVVTLTQNAT